MGRIVRSAALFVVLGALASCAGEETASYQIAVQGWDAAVAQPDISVASPDSNVGQPAMFIISVYPSHGPFIGGTAITITGVGFTKNSVVTVGGRRIQVGQAKVESSSKIVVVTPAGTVGPAAVVVTAGKASYTLKNGFTYDPVYLDPSSGPTAGGTLVNVYGTGTTFAKGMKLELGGRAFTDIEVVSTTRVRAKTPLGMAGWSNLVVGGGNGGQTATIKEAYRYYESTNPRSGGLGGGPIKGTLTVSVLDAMSRAPLPEAMVVVQDVSGVKFAKKTGLGGVVVFTDKNFIGPVNVTAGAKKYETTTIASFDARDATLLLFPIIEPSMGPMPPGPLAGKVEGYVMFGGQTGIGSTRWPIVPDPTSTDEVKRCYVYASSSSLSGKLPTESPTGTIDYKPGKQTAWPYSLAVAPRAQAIYAVAGIYNKTTKKFVPYAMGVTRGVVVGPAETRKNVDILVEIPLDQKVILALNDVPASAKMYKLRMAIDLGAEGFILREDLESKGLTVPPTSFNYTRLPEMTRAGLRDASYAIDAQLDAGGTFEKPYVPFVRGTTRSVKPKNGLIVMDKFVGPTTFVDPKSVGTLTNNKLTWTPTGATASVALTLVVTTSMAPVWRIITPGNNSSVTLPDPTTVGLTAMPSGSYLVWAQIMVHLPSYSFEKFNYDHLSSRYWDRWSQAQSYFKTPTTTTP